MALKAKTTSVAGRPRLIHPSLVAAGASLLIGALVSDIFYWQTALFQWTNFSVWLITGGLLLALVAGVALLVDVMLLDAGPISWGHFAALAAAALLSLLNAFIHSRDAWTTVVPQGITLSALVTILLLCIGWRGWSVTKLSTHSTGGRS